MRSERCSYERPCLPHPASSIRPSERQAPYLSGSTGAARGRAHGEIPPLPCGRSRGKRFGEGAPPASRLPAGGRTHLAKGLLRRATIFDGAVFKIDDARDQR